MAKTHSSSTTDGTWLARWEPEDENFWRDGGATLAWRTLIITTLNLTMAFMVWFLVSALVVRLPQIGFKFAANQLFWLAAMPGLAGGTLRLVHMFLTPIYGTRNVVALSTLSLLLPLVGWFYAVQDPSTPYWMLLLLAFLAGLGGGIFLLLCHQRVCSSQSVCRVLRWLFKQGLVTLVFRLCSLSRRGL